MHVLPTYSDVLCMNTVQLLLSIALNANIPSTAEPVRIYILYMATTCLHHTWGHQAAAARSEGTTRTADRFRQIQLFVAGMLLSGLQPPPKSWLCNCMYILCNMAKHLSA